VLVGEGDPAKAVDTPFEPVHEALERAGVALFRRRRERLV
jgi:hypothetical protein